MSSFQVNRGEQKNILVIWGRENRLVGGGVTQESAARQASAKPRWLGSNQRYHMSVDSAAVKELERNEWPVPVRTSQTVNLSEQTVHCISFIVSEIRLCCFHWGLIVSLKGN